ncbi:MAG TPA: hypothetical protein VNA04_10490 [Thermoanaerobaculia bacterium]|nr:hypothetical protein [Thermoanaerobaculia bacterium]
MEDIRPYRLEEETKEREEERQRELETAKAEEEVPFHIPRD